MTDDGSNEAKLQSLTPGLYDSLTRIEQRDSDRAYQFVRKQLSQGKVSPDRAVQRAYSYGYWRTYRKLSFPFGIGLALSLWWDGRVWMLVLGLIVTTTALVLLVGLMRRGRFMNEYFLIHPDQAELPQDS